MNLACANAQEAQIAAVSPDRRGSSRKDCTDSFDSLVGDIPLARQGSSAVRAAHHSRTTAQCGDASDCGSSPSPLDADAISASTQRSCEVHGAAGAQLASRPGGRAASLVRDAALDLSATKHRLQPDAMVVDGSVAASDALWVLLSALTKQNASGGDLTSSSIEASAAQLADFAPDALCSLGGCVAKAEGETGMAAAFPRLNAEAGLPQFLDQRQLRRSQSVPDASSALSFSQVDAARSGVSANPQAGTFIAAEPVEQLAAAPAFRSSALEFAQPVSPDDRGRVWVTLVEQGRHFTAANSQSTGLAPTGGGPAAMIDAIEAFQVARPQISSHLKLTLHPQELGQVEVTLNLRQDQLSVRLETLKASTVSLLEQRQDDLVQALSSAGYDVSGVEIRRVSECALSTGDGAGPDNGLTRDNRHGGSEKGNPASRGNEERGPNDRDDNEDASGDHAHDPRARIRYI
ncbi:MAG: flagellar hook-length control protein FliK [Beijerinckiaceae bacterium]